MNRLSMKAHGALFCLQKRLARCAPPGKIGGGVRKRGESRGIKMAPKPKIGKL